MRSAWVLLFLGWVAVGCEGGSSLTEGQQVAAVEITPAAPRATVGHTVQLTAVVRDAAGNVLPGRPVFWASSDSAVASVSPSGMVQARAPGTAQIAASAEQRSGLVTLVVAPPAVGNVTVEPASATLTALADTVRLRALVRDATGAILLDRTVNWTSSAPAVAAVSSTGVVTAVAGGVATISAEADGVVGTATVGVAQRVARISITPPSVSLPLGDTVRLRATVSDANGFAVPGAEVAWGSSNTLVAPVDASGLVRGVGTGQATITAAAGGVEGTASIAVALTSVGSVEVTPPSLSLRAGERAALSAIVRDERGNVLTGREITWASDDPTLATVDAQGGVTALGAGTATVRAASGGKVGVATVAIAPPARAPVATVEVTPSVATLIVGGALQLTANLRDERGISLTGREITWTSSNSAIATVNANGVVNGVAVGSALITASSEGKSGTASIVVTPPPPVPVASVEVEPESATIPTGETAQFTATLRDANNNVLNGRSVVWTSSNTDVATVDPNGVVTAVARGETTITAASEQKRGTARVTVIPAPVATVEVKPASATVYTGKTLQLTATLRDRRGQMLTDRTVKWSSSDRSVATVDENGLVQGIVPGSVTITATSEDQSGSAAITVTLPPVAAVEVSPSSTEIRVRTGVQLSATLRDADGNVLTGRSVTWSSEDPAVATVDTTGVVTGTGAGTVTIRAASEGKTGSSTVRVLSGPTFPPATVVMVSGSGQTGKNNETLPQPLVVAVFDATGTPVPGVQVFWTTNNGSVSPSVSVTNSQGQASTAWTLGGGGNDKERAAIATVDGLPSVTFTAKKDGG